MLNNRILFLLLFSFLLFGCNQNKIIVVDPPVPYGEMYIYENTATTTISSSGKWHNITANVISGQLTGFVGGGGLIAEIGGIYKGDYSLSFIGVADTDFDFTIGINGYNLTNCHSRTGSGATGQKGNTGGSCMFSLSKDDNVTLMVLNLDNTNNIIAEEANLNLLKIGD
tara:strand:+ start:332 stop:838 length:507 start_codon:yes stop_codon:yes gene_type:complete